MYSDKVKNKIKSKTLNWAVHIVVLSRPQQSHEASYENIDNIHPELELHTLGSMLMETGVDEDPERIPLDARQRRPSMKRLVRQASTVNTQKTTEGTMKLAYWF